MPVACTPRSWEGDVTEEMPTLSIVIPTYNAVGKVEGLLTRLCHFHTKYGSGCEVIVSDDASTDGTAAKLRNQFPWLTVVEGRTNRGFGANVMAGAAHAKNEYLATLNTDIELVGNPFKDLIDELERHPRLFATMPLIYNRRLEKVENLSRLYGRRGLVWHTELPEEEQWSNMLRELLSSAADIKSRLHDVAGTGRPILSVLCAAAFVCRRERFEQLGGFDPRYFPFYWEDVDLDYKARRSGWRCAVVPRAAVIHRHSETIDQVHGERKLQFLRLNQLRFVSAHRDQLKELRGARLWWWARGVREAFGGDPLLRSAYFRAAFGLRDF